MHGILKLAHDPFALSRAKGIRSRLLALGAPQIHDALRELNFLVSQPHHGRDASLPLGVMHRQIANVGFGLRGAAGGVAIGLQRILIAG